MLQAETGLSGKEGLITDFFIFGGSAFPQKQDKNATNTTDVGVVYVFY